MAKVLLVTQADEGTKDSSFLRGSYNHLKRSAESGLSYHSLVDDPAEADIILFAKFHVSFGYHLQQHPFYKGYQDKCFAFAVDVVAVPIVPGVYSSLEKSWHFRDRTRAGFYLSAMENPYLEFAPGPIERDLLYSFMGATNTWPTRAALAKLNHPRGFFLDTSSESLPIMSAGTDEQREAFWKRYADIIRRSKFVLCPRGMATSSIRLFETMQMGRVPVILSDEWVPPDGPCWDEFSIRIPEKEVLNLPQILEKREGEALRLGLKARQEWERWFAPEVVFNTVVDWCLDIKKSRRVPEVISRLAVYPNIVARPKVLRAYARFWKNKLTGQLDSK
jgi:Exostosin family